MAQVTPAQPFLLHDGTVVLRFNGSMDPDSLDLTGDLAADSPSVSWMAAATADDTLTLAPNPTWTTGQGRTLTVNVRDSDGVAAAPYATAFGVFDGLVYVNAVSGTGGAAGTQIDPFDTVSEAYAYADINYTFAAVLVAAAGYSSGSALSLIDGISLFGGFSAFDWERRDTSAYPSVLSDTRTTGGATNNPLRPLDADSTITAATVVDGLTLNAATGSVSAAMFVNGGSPTLRNLTATGGASSIASYGLQVLDGSPTVSASTLSGGGGGTNQDATGIRVEQSGGTAAPTITGNTIRGNDTGTDNAAGIHVLGGATPTIEGNAISAGSYTAVGVSAGVYLDTSDATIRNNTIDGGSSTLVHVRGMFVSNASPLIEGNTISAGSTTNATQSSYGIDTRNGGTAVIVGNTIDGGSAPTTHGIYTFTGATPIIVNNVVYGGDATGFSFGVRITSGVADLVNNTIDAGSAGVASTASGISMEGTGANARIENNIVVTRNTGGTNYCVRELAGNDPTSFLNNDLYACSTALYHDDENSSGKDLATISEVEADLNAEGFGDIAAGNASDDPAFADAAGANYHLTTGTLASVTQGGLDQTVYFNTNTLALKDRDGVTRTGDGSTGWSMGAYEY